MLDIGIKMAPQATANSYLTGKEIAQKFGFPLVIRKSRSSAKKKRFSDRKYR